MLEEEFRIGIKAIILISKPIQIRITLFAESEINVPKTIIDINSMVFGINVSIIKIGKEFNLSNVRLEVLI